ncbi:MAG: hypothetical protein DRQ78_02375 [Epsilonproteobacteria bacterium]|nr:MAG: hypothetical protein DRQ78_02375 [Campylobacterota bacterium]
MSIFFKYLTSVLILVLLSFFYLFYTDSGKTHIYKYVEKKLSKKTDLRIKIESISLQNYPIIIANMHVEEKFKLIVIGQIDDELLDINYTLTGNCIQINNCKINDNINIKGQAEGSFSKLNIAGKGKALGGDIHYKAIKFPNKVENLKLTMSDVNSSKLLILLGQESLIEGKANIHVDLKHMSKNKRQGTFTYEVKDKYFSNIPLHLYTKVHLNNMQQYFTMDISSPYFVLTVFNGEYLQDKKRAKASYILDVKNLAPLETLLGYAYQGPFYARGEVHYDAHLRISGLSKSYGGMLDFLFEKDTLQINLASVSFKNIMNLLDYPSLIDAETIGTIHYYFHTDILNINTQLKKAKFLPSKLANVIHEKTSIAILDERFDNSTLLAEYQQNMLSGDLKLVANNGHILLTNTGINTSKNTIDASFDFKLQAQEFSGKIHGSLSEPEVSLDMQKLIQYQMTKQVDTLVGESNRKNAEDVIEQIPMGGTAKDVATDMATQTASSLMEAFF